jgi:hypothetical protein
LSNNSCVENISAKFVFELYKRLSVHFRRSCRFYDLIKTCSWNILYFIPYTLMIKFTSC